MKKIVFYILTLLIPVLFIAVFEYSLRASEYGTDYRVFIEDENKDYMLLNPDLGKKYFLNDEDFTKGQYDLFRKEKGENTFRVFALGASTVAGFPYQHGASFPRILEHRLQSSNNDLNIEVVNVSLAATNSYFLADVISEVLAHKPDAIIIYSGHNEYYGSFGVGSTHKISARWFIPRYLKLLKSSRIVQLIRNLIKSDNSTDKFDGTLMAKMVGDKSIELNSTQYKKGISQYEKNMIKVLDAANEAGVPVFIGTLFSNVKDQQPFISSSQPDEKRGTENAMKLYEKGIDLLNSGAIDSARYYLERAKDNDLLRFRASEDLNDLIQSWKKEDVLIVDLKNSLSQHSEREVIGNELIAEHLHPNLKGNELIAEAFDSSISNYFEFKNDSLNKPNTFEKTYSTLDSIYGELLVGRLTSTWPFTESFAYEDTASVKFTTYPQELAYKRSLEQLTWVAAQNTLFNYYYSAGDFKNALRCALALSQEYPHILEPNMMTASCYFQLDNLEKEVWFLKKSLAINQDPGILHNIGVRLFAFGTEEDAFQIITENLSMVKSAELVNLYNDIAKTINLKKELESSDSKELINNNLIEIYLKNRCFQKAEGLINDLRGNVGNSEMVMNFERRLLTLKSDKRNVKSN
ncbi:MAG: SGNH/GDSL hydrolase family protein [Cyclobacteriaceae bacterium]